MAVPQSVILKRTLPVGMRAQQGERVRAEPVAALYEQGKVSHCGLFNELEDQLTSWDASTSNESPDRLDALVHALTELMLQAPEKRWFTSEQIDGLVAPDIQKPSAKRRQVFMEGLYRG